MDWLLILAIYGAVSGTRNTFSIGRQGEQIEHLKARLREIEPQLNDNASRSRDAESSQTIEKLPPSKQQSPQPNPAPPTFESSVERVYDVIRRAIKGRPRDEDLARQRDEDPQVTERPHHVPNQPAAQAESSQSTSQAGIEKFFAAVLEKNQRQAAGQWQDPQVDRAVRMVMDALDEHASDSELARHVDVALEALKHHAAGWNNHRKK